MRLSTAVFNVILLAIVCATPTFCMRWPDEPDLGCFKRCTDAYIPLCASDRSTYANECQFENARCRKVQLFKLHAGECEKGPENRLCRPSPFCNKAYRPLCGSNGKTYSNPCQLFYDACFIPDLNIVEFAPCEATDGEARW